MKKYFADIITGLRIIGSIILLFIPLLSRPFYVLYLFCGFSDMIDGTIARKLNTVSSLGSKLDTIADLVFIVASSIKILPVINISIFLWIWIIIISTIKISDLILCFMYKNKFVDLHTTLNKATGLLLFILPLILQFIEPIFILSTVCIVASIAAVQEQYCIIRLKNTYK